MYTIIICMIFFVPILISFFKTGLVNKIHTLIVCGFTVLAAVQSFFSGLLLDTIMQKNRQDFEIRLIWTRKMLDSHKKD